jgi:glycosyltransferase involved in cell wall biosynthesis
MKISATIITFNEEAQIRQCLESLQNVADEIVVVDSMSMDRTCEIAVSLGARVIQRAWTNYSDQKNFAASQTLHPWILSLDADECLSELLRTQLMEVKRTHPQVAAFCFPRKAFYLGRWIQHSGWYPDVKIRLYNKMLGQWRGDFVHESVEVSGPVQLIQADLLHFTCDSLSEHLVRMDRYTTLAAADLWRQGKRGRWSQLFFSPLATFVKTYFFQAGFLDGFQGMIIAIFAAYYNFLKYAKLWEKGQERKAEG